MQNTTHNTRHATGAPARTGEQPVYTHFPTDGIYVYVSGRGFRLATTPVPRRRLPLPDGGDPSQDFRWAS